MSSPRVTVIIPTYNLGAVLATTIASVRQQDCGDWELLVAGDGCTDASEAIVASYADERLHWLNLPTNTGTCTAPFNAALARARGEFTMLLNHDDVLFPWHLSACLAALDATGADAAYDYSYCVTPHGVTLHGPPYGADATETMDHTTDSMLVRTACIQRIGGLRPREGLLDYLDRDYLIRLLRSGVRVTFTPVSGCVCFPSQHRQREAAPGLSAASLRSELLTQPREVERRFLLAVAGPLCRHQPHHAPAARLLLWSLRQAVRLTARGLREWPLLRNLARHRQLARRARLAQLRGAGR